MIHVLDDALYVCKHACEGPRRDNVTASGKASVCVCTHHTTIYSRACLSVPSSIPAPLWRVGREWGGGGRAGTRLPRRGRLTRDVREDIDGALDCLIGAPVFPIYVIRSAHAILRKSSNTEFCPSFRPTPLPFPPPSPLCLYPFSEWFSLAFSVSLASV